ATQVARGAARDRQADRGRADDRLRNGYRLGEAKRTCDSRRLVSGAARGQRGRRRAVRRCESFGTTAGHVLQGEREAAALRGLQHGRAYLSLLQGRAAVSVRSWPLVYDVRVLGIDTRSLASGGDGSGDGDRSREERRSARRRGGRAALRASCRCEGDARAQGAARNREDRALPGRG